MDELVSLQGPVELVDGTLMLRIPLEAGGAALQTAARGISTVDEACLNITIPDWLAAKLGIAEGSIVAVDNRNGKLNITPVHPDDSTL
ncbi:MAG TPA: hypothetical protein VJW73_07185 [Gemmatimonadaceae bacterium]|nr:hypothetical protein [Gemmatimonadaceae bacterium]